MLSLKQGRSYWLSSISGLEWDRSLISVDSIELKTLPCRRQSQCHWLWSHFKYDKRCRFTKFRSFNISTVFNIQTHVGSSCSVRLVAQCVLTMFHFNPLSNRKTNWSEAQDIGYDGKRVWQYCIEYVGFFTWISCSVFAWFPLSPPNSDFFRSFRSAVWNPERSHWMGMPQMTNGGPERARKQSLGEREGESVQT